MDMGNRIIHHNLIWKKFQCIIIMSLWLGIMMIMTMTVDILFSIHLLLHLETRTQDIDSLVGIGLVVIHLGEPNIKRNLILSPPLLLLFCPKAPQKNKRGGEQREGPEGEEELTEKGEECK